jgi:CDP-diacylglycerol--glycerol-3-phosphate 3-phosphatidyltransferase
LSGSDPTDSSIPQPDPASAGAGEPAALEPDKPEMWSRERVVTGWAQLWNVPNMLTLLRILMIPLFWYLLMYDGGDNATTRIAATGVFMFAAYTDWLDGHLARKQGLVTTFGKIADPLADKALTGVAFIGLSAIGELWWWVTILVIAREVGVTLIRFVVLKHGVIPASRGGKAKTASQMLAIVLFLLPIPGSLTVLTWIRNAVMASAVLLTALTGIDYIDKAIRTRSDSKSDKADKAARRARVQEATEGPTGGPSGADGSGGSSRAGGSSGAVGPPGPDGHATSSDAAQ